MAFFNPPEMRKPGFRFALFGCAFTVIVIALGAFTRLVDAGLGCPDWPGCYGHLLWPVQQEHVAAANEAWPEFPVDHSKTWPEMVHRYFAAGLGLIAIALVAISWRNRRIDPSVPFKLAVALLALVIVQGLFGKWTVTLKLWPQVVTAHLLGGFATLALLWLITLRLNNRRFILPPGGEGWPERIRPWAWAALAVVVAQIVLGGWTTSNYAAAACPDLPTCQGYWLPPMDLGQGFDIFQSVGPNYLGGVMDNEARVAIHFMHRVGAVVTTVALLLLCWQLLRSGIGWLRSHAWVIGGVLALQLTLGIGNIVVHFPVFASIAHPASGEGLLPVWVAVAHNLGGVALLLTVVTLLYSTRTARTFEGVAR